MRRSYQPFATLLPVFRLMPDSDGQRSFLQELGNQYSELYDSTTSLGESNIEILPASSGRYRSAQILQQ
ncbi:hypothetical protein OIU78_010074 [Salix suchowensis]|nr:hypothetical protein OIU78_010074 [Salix suchowensis]